MLKSIEPLRWNCNTFPGWSPTCKVATKRHMEAIPGPAQPSEPHALQAGGVLLLRAANAMISTPSPVVLTHHDLSPHQKTA